MDLPKRPTMTEKALREIGYEQISRVPMVFAHRQQNEDNDRTIIYIEQRNRKEVYFCCYDGLTKFVEDLTLPIF